MIIDNRNVGKKEISQSFRGILRISPDANGEDTGIDVTETMTVSDSLGNPTTISVSQSETKISNITLSDKVNINANANSDLIWSGNASFNKEIELKAGAKFYTDIKFDTGASISKDLPSKGQFLLASQNNGKYSPASLENEVISIIEKYLATKSQYRTVTFYHMGLSNPTGPSTGYTANAWWYPDLTNKRDINATAGVTGPLREQNPDMPQDYTHIYSDCFEGAQLSKAEIDKIVGTNKWRLVNATAEAWLNDWDNTNRKWVDNSSAWRQIGSASGGSVNSYNAEWNASAGGASALASGDKIVLKPGAWNINPAAWHAYACTWLTGRFGGVYGIGGDPGETSNSRNSNLGNCTQDPGPNDVKGSGPMWPQRLYIRYIVTFLVGGY